MLILRLPDPSPSEARKPRTITTDRKPRGDGIGGASSSLQDLLQRGSLPDKRNCAARPARAVRRWAIAQATSCRLASGRKKACARFSNRTQAVTFFPGSDLRDRLHFFTARSEMAGGGAPGYWSWRLSHARDKAGRRRLQPSSTTNSGTESAGPEHHALRSS